LDCSKIADVVLFLLCLLGGGDRKADLRLQISLMANQPRPPYVPPHEIRLNIYSYTGFTTTEILLSTKSDDET